MENKIYTIKKPKIMGILNVTPDSFSDAGKYLSLDKAIQQAHHLASQGADIIDIGGESTRPGAEPVSCEEELRRILPVVKQLIKEIAVPLAIDTYKPKVALNCLDLGISMINDVSGLRDPEMVHLIARYQVPIVIMHLPAPRTMQQYANYQDVTAEVKTFLRERIILANNAGIEKIIVDPGFGFGKTAEQNYQLLEELSSLKELSCPIMIGPSRKRFNRDCRKIDALNVLVTGLLHGAAILRVHNAELGFRARARYQEIIDLEK